MKWEPDPLIEKFSRAAMRDFAGKFVPYLMQSDLSEPQWNDIHLMFGAVCALSELQQALPGEFLLRAYIAAVHRPPSVHLTDDIKIGPTARIHSAPPGILFDF